MKQTAVEWLWEQIDNTIPFQNIQTSQIFNGLLEQAKEMEKEQMCDFFREGYMWCNSPSLRIENGEIVTSTMKYGEFYYNEKYKKTEQWKQQ